VIEQLPERPLDALAVLADVVDIYLFRTHSVGVSKGQGAAVLTVLRRAICAAMAIRDAGFSEAFSFL
jgi:hypothetical protein